MDTSSFTLPSILKEFEYIATTPEKIANKWKRKTGGKVIGLAGLDIPEPLIHAAGMLPVVLLENDEEITLANAHVEMHQCGYIRSLIDQAMKRKLAYCDELLFHDCCHIIRMLGDAMHSFCDKIPKVRFVYFPPMLEYDTAQKYTATEMGKLRTRLEVMSGRIITEERLAASIALFNRQRKMLIKLYDIRRSYPGILKGSDVSNIVAAGMCMPKEEHIALLEQLLRLLEPEKKNLILGKIPVIVHGSLCQRCDNSILNEIEVSGGVIVDDDLYVGSKYFNTLFDESLPPMDSLLEAYIHRTSPCATRYEERNPGDYLISLQKNAKARGIIFVVVKFCEAHDYQYFLSHRKFEESGVREMLIETEPDGKSEGQLKTRLQGFFESLGE